MKLFGRKKKAEEKWRGVAKIIDLRKTKVTFIETAQEPIPVGDAWSWFNQAMRDVLGAVSDDSCVRDLSESEAPPALPFYDGRSVLDQEKMSGHMSSEEFSRMYEKFFGQQNAPFVKYQDPDAWRK